MRFFKKFLVLSFLLVTVSYYLVGDRAGVKVKAKVFGGPPLGFTGAPNEGTCIGCHYTFGEPNVPNSGGSVQLTGLPSTFSPGQTYTVTVTVAHPTARRWGFELTVINATGDSIDIGTLTILDNIKTIKRSAGSRIYISHYATESSPPAEDGTAPGKSGSNSWSFSWTAPAATAGDVTFYVAGNAANNQVTPEDDYIYTTSALVRGPNAAPVFSALSDRVLGVGDRISFTVGATDPDGTPLTLDASALANAIFDAGTKRFTFTPSPGQMGTSQVTFTASDGRLQTQQTVNLLVMAETSSALQGIVKPSGQSNYLDSSQASGIEMTASGSFGTGAKVVFNGIELASQSAVAGIEGMTTQLPSSELANPGAFVVRVRLSNGALTNARVLGLASNINNQQAVTIEAASYSAPVAPGQIAALFGTNLIVGSNAAAAATIPLPRSLQNTSVYIDGVQSPLFYASTGQINYQIPYSTATGQAAVVILRDDGVASYGTVQVSDAAGAIFTANSSGQGQAAAVNGDFSTNGDPATNPQLKRATKGGFVVLFATGTGGLLVNSATGQPALPKDGEAASSNPLIATSSLPLIAVGGTSATVHFSGLAPGFVGLWQLNVQIPTDAPSGAAVEVSMTFGGRNSNRVTIAIE